MSRFQARRKKEKLIYSQVTILCLVVLIIILGRATWGIYERERFTQEQKGNILAEVTALEGQKENLEGNINKLKTEEGVEELIRTKFPVAKPNEGVIAIVGEEQTKEEGAEDEKPWWKKVFGE